MNDEKNINTYVAITKEGLWLIKRIVTMIQDSPHSKKTGLIKIALFCAVYFEHVSSVY